MIKAFFSSTAIHIIIIATVIFSFSKEITKTSDKHTKKISLKHIVLKEEKPQKIKKPKEDPKPTIPQKTIEKKIQEPKPKPKPKKILKQKEKPKIKKKKPQKKRKKSHHKKVKKTALKKHTKHTKLEPTPIVQTPKQDYLLLNKSKIYEAIQRAKRYPRLAKKLHITGIVKVRFKLHPNGEVTHITTSNAHNLLQKSARNTILEASSEFPKPNTTVTISLNIAYKLR